MCISAELPLLTMLNPSLEVEVVHLGKNPQRLIEAVQAGVESVPAIVYQGQVLHLNFGAAIEDLT